jgi:DNA-directed RNA polymerase beta subunit
VVIGKTSREKKYSKFTTDEDQKKCQSTTCKKDEFGVVVESSILGLPHGKKAVVTVATSRPVCVGDKFSTYLAQKGVVGRLVSQEDMPYSMDTGVAPDMIISPVSLPTRMTMSTLAENVIGKATALSGNMDLGEDPPVLSTSNRFKVREAEEALAAAGFRRSGKETFVDGTTGEVLGGGGVFVGISEVFRLNHLASHKVWARSTGPVNPTTRQAKEGRRFGGGLRVGDMEKNALVAHGVSRVLTERFREMSDLFTIYVCSKCEVPIDFMNEEIGYFFCNGCQDSKSVCRVKLGFTFWIQVMELFALGVKIRFNVAPPLTL